MVRLAASVLGVALLAGLGPGCGEPVAEPGPPPGIVLIVIDTLRADHLQPYGYERATSPVLQALADRGVLYEKHMASAGQTVPSTLTLMTSLHPAEHGFRHRHKGFFSRNRPVYPDELVFLPEVLADAGYATAGFVGNPFLQRDNGFDQGFDRFLYSKELGETLTDAALTWLGERQAASADQPFFLYMHYFDVHTPYRPPGDFMDMFPRPEGGRIIERNGVFPGANEVDVAATTALYDGGIAYIDAEVGRLLAWLEERGLGDSTVVAVTSDHGEEFMDHGGFGHGTSVYGELVRVPLVLAGPGVEGTGVRVEGLTHHLDLGPTLLALAGLDPPPSFRGNPFAVEADVPAAFAENGAWAAVFANGRKLIVDERDGSALLFSIDDVLDAHPLDDSHAEARLRERLAWYRSLEPVSDMPLTDDGWSPEERARLEALGYTK